MRLLLVILITFGAILCGAKAEDEPQAYFMHIGSILRSAVNDLQYEDEDDEVADEFFDQNDDDDYYRYDVYQGNEGYQDDDEMEGYYDDDRYDYDDDFYDNYEVSGEYDDEYEGSYQDKRDDYYDENDEYSDESSEEDYSREGDDLSEDDRRKGRGGHGRHRPSRRRGHSDHGQCHHHHHHLHHHHGGCHPHHHHHSQGCGHHHHHHGSSHHHGRHGPSHHHGCHHKGHGHKHHGKHPMMCPERKFHNCSAEFYEGLGFKGHPKDAADFAKHLNSLIQSKGKNGFKMICQAGQKFAKCLGLRTLKPCLSEINLRWILGMSRKDATIYRLISRELFYQCAFANKTIVSKWDCLQKTSKSANATVTKCAQDFAQKVKKDPRNVCKYEQQLINCTTGPYKKACGAEAGTVVCNEMRIALWTLNPPHVRCRLRCQKPKSDDRVEFGSAFGALMPHLPYYYNEEENLIDYAEF